MRLRLPVRHVGSVDVLLEAIDRSRPGDMLVVDNGGRLDEACVGDLVTLEAAQAGLAGIVIDGLHRDTRELRTIRLPVLSRGALPADALTTARLREHEVTSADLVLADDDGLLLLPAEHAAEIAEAAAAIPDAERRQAARMRTGISLREQAGFAAYLAARDRRGTTFREHLRAVGGEIEE